MHVNADRWIVNITRQGNAPCRPSDNDINTPALGIIPTSAPWSSAVISIHSPLLARGGGMLALHCGMPHWHGASRPPTLHRRPCPLGAIRDEDSPD